MACNRRGAATSEDKAAIRVEESRPARTRAGTAARRIIRVLSLISSSGVPMTAYQAVKPA